MSLLTFELQNCLPGVETIPQDSLSLYKAQNLTWVWNFITTSRLNQWSKTDCHAPFLNTLLSWE